MHTRLTEMFGFEHPILCAPMGIVAGGKLAAAVTGAGGLGLILTGEAIGLIREISPAAEIVRRMASEAEELLGRAQGQRPTGA
jgi:NAD(P)H-dependent flavin oxidoreductase YrpB (nitropropane dioxygenase family)